MKEYKDSLTKYTATPTNSPRETPQSRESYFEQHDIPTQEEESKVEQTSGSSSKRELKYVDDIVKDGKPSPGKEEEDEPPKTQSPLEDAGYYDSSDNGTRSILWRIGSLLDEASFLIQVIVVVLLISLLFIFGCQ